jgi:hypothetical protein
VTYRFIAFFKKANQKLASPIKSVFAGFYRRSHIKSVLVRFFEKAFLLAFL